MTKYDHPRGKFPLGQIFIELVAFERLIEPELLEFLKKYQMCEWDDITEKERDANLGALQSNGIVNARHTDSNGRKYLVFTNLQEDTTKIIIIRH